MRFKNAFFTTVFCLLSSIVFAQHQPIVSVLVQTNTTEFTIKANSVSELQQMDWNSVKSFFADAKNNAPEQRILLTFMYVNTSGYKKGENTKIDNIKLISEGKLKALDTLLNKLQADLKRIDDHLF